MISVVVFSPSLLRPAGADVAPEAIVRSLSALVRGAVEGLIGDVTIAGAAGDQLAEIADHAGCGFVEVADPAQGLFRGITASRGPALFLLQAGYAPNAGFIEEAGDLLGEPRPFVRRAAVGRAAQFSDPALPRLFAFGRADRRARRGPRRRRHRYRRAGEGPWRQARVAHARPARAVGMALHQFSQVKTCENWLGATAPPSLCEGLSSVAFHRDRRKIF